MRISRKHFWTLAVLLLAYVIATAGWMRARWARRAASRQQQTVVASQRFLSSDQLRADIYTVVCAVRYLLEPEQSGTNSAVASGPAAPGTPGRAGETAITVYPPPPRHAS
jgi:hypothetical protein